MYEATNDPSIEPVPPNTEVPPKKTEAMVSVSYTHLTLPTILRV